MFAKDLFLHIMLTTNDYNYNAYNVYSKILFFIASTDIFMCLVQYGVQLHLWLLYTFIFSMEKMYTS